MKTALELLREKKKPKLAVAIVDEQKQPDMLANFFADPLPPSPTKPPLPAHLEPFAWVHRIAATGGMPADKAAEVLAAVNEAADHKGLRRASALEELEELEAWLQAWMLERVETAEPDPFTPCEVCKRGIGEPAEGCSGKHLD